MQLIQSYSIIQLVKKSSEQQRYGYLINVYSNSLIQFYSIEQKILFKNGNGSTEIQEVTKTVAKTVTGQTAQSLFDQGGRYSSVFIRLAGFSGATAVILGKLE